MTKRHLVYGAPGTGKTTWIQRKVAEICKQTDYRPSDILYATFNKSMATTARDRLAEAFGYDHDMVEAAVSTIHSHCLRLVREAHGYIDVVKSKHIRAFSKLHGYAAPFEFNVVDDVEGLAQPFETTYWDMYNTYWVRYPFSDLKLAFFYFEDRVSNSTLDSFVHFFNLWTEYKSKNKLLDFVDMARIVLEEHLCPDFAAIQFYDEHQDVFPLLERVVEMWAEGADEVYAAGDPLQVLYGFSGANPGTFLNFIRDETTVLDFSYRLPKPIWDLALHVIRGHTRYYPADRPVNSVRAGDKRHHIGSMKSYKLRDVALRLEESGTETIIIARTNRQLRDMVTDLASGGIAYRPISYRAGYFGLTPTNAHLINGMLKLYSGKKSQLSMIEIRALEKNTKPAKDFWRWGVAAELKRGGELTSGELRRKMICTPDEFLDRFMSYTRDTKRKDMCRLGSMIIQKRLIRQLPVPHADNRCIKVGTIHSAKGDEADCVILNTGMTPWAQRQDWEENLRCFYVGITRSKHTLMLLNDEYDVFAPLRRLGVTA